MEKKASQWKRRHLLTITTDYDYPKTIGIKLLAGRDFSRILLIQPVILNGQLKGCGLKIPWANC
jgi:hypothetical protein